MLWKNKSGVFQVKNLIKVKCFLYTKMNKRRKFSSYSSYSSYSNVTFIKTEDSHHIKLIKQDGGEKIIGQVEEHLLVQKPSAT